MNAIAQKLLSDLSKSEFDMSIFIKTHPSLTGVTKDILIIILQRIIEIQTTSTSCDDESDTCPTPCASIVMRAYSASVTKTKSPEQELIELIEEEFIAQSNQGVASDMILS